MSLHSSQKTTIRLPGVPGVWLFVLLDSSIFAILFLSFTLEKIANPNVYAADMSAMNVTLGSINTIILLTSSWLMALATQEVKCVSKTNIRKIKILISAAAALGIVFIVCKINEYIHVVSAGHTLNSSSFYMYYFVTTGLHMFHVFIGIIALSLVCTVAVKSESEHTQNVVETVATYWHMVDFLWVMIFPLFYLAVPK
jgi:nitric oxide reductase NorE protein